MSKRLKTLNVNMRIRNSARFTTGLIARRSCARKPSSVAPKITVMTVVRSAPSVSTLRRSSRSVSMTVRAISSAAPR